MQPPFAHEQETHCSIWLKCLDIFDALRVKDVYAPHASRVKANISSTIKAHLIRGAFYLLLLLAICAIPFALGQPQARAPSSQENPTGTLCTGGWSAGPDLPSPGVRMVGVYFGNPKFYAMGGRSMDGVATTSRIHLNTIRSQHLGDKVSDISR